MTIPSGRIRPIRSFVRRESKCALARALILQAYGNCYGIEPGSGPIHPPSIFGRVAPLVLEIGFGRGETLFQMAKLAPMQDFIGIEVYRTGVSQLLTQIAADPLRNLRVLTGDARTILQQRIPDASLDTVQIFFPDPWPKRRHHKRRLIQGDFIKLIALKLKPGGILHLATDWRDYAVQMMDLLSALPCFENQAGVYRYTPRPSVRPYSKYERRGLALGDPSWDLIFKRLYNKDSGGV